MCLLFCFFSSRRRYTRCAVVTGVQTCALPICLAVAVYDATERIGVDSSEARPDVWISRSQLFERPLEELVRFSGLRSLRRDHLNENAEVATHKWHRPHSFRS